MAKEGNYAQILLPSGEVRMIHIKCKATVGRVGNENMMISSLKGRALKMAW